MGVSAKYLAERDRLHQAGPDPEPIRLFVRRPDQERQDVLLRRLRRIPQDRADSDVCDDSDNGSTQRNSQRADSESIYGSGLRRRENSGFSNYPVRQSCFRRSAGAERGGTQQQPSVLTEADDEDG